MDKKKFNQKSIFSNMLTVNRDNCNFDDDLDNNYKVLVN